MIASWIIRRSRTLDDFGARNMVLLTQLRWVALAGQLAAILAAALWLRVPLPIMPMLAILAGLAILNIATLAYIRADSVIANHALFGALLVDWAALAGQLYLSGGATNPFAPIGLLQIVVAVVLLETWSSWVLVALHSVALGVLAFLHYPLDLPPLYRSLLSPTYLLAAWVNFTFASVLIALVVTRVTRNLRRRDRHLAQMQQREAEEDHIVRMGLLASGAAHELGTPLASLSVILGDWTKQSRLAGDPALAEDMSEMQAAVARCKAIVGGILYASGEARSDGVARSSLAAYVAQVARDWDAQRPGVLTLDNALDRPLMVAANRTLTQVLINLLDNAVEAGAERVILRAEIVEEELRLSVRDDGPGFSKDILATIGRPYRSSSDRQGAGLGLFLAVNVLRKLGGTVKAENLFPGGARVTLAMPLDALRLEDEDG